MKPRMCMTVHNPPKSYGDCIRACIATLTDDDKVPHVFTGNVESVCPWGQLRAYLKTKGKFLFLTTVEDPFEEFTEENPDIAFMLMCRTAKGNHAVICKNGVVVHNPSYYKSEIIGPPKVMDDDIEDKWVVGIIGDLV